MEFNQKQEKSTKIYKILKGKIMEEPQPICININICIWGSLLSQAAPLKECVVNMWGKKRLFIFNFFPVWPFSNTLLDTPVHWRSVLITWDFRLMVYLPLYWCRIQMDIKKYISPVLELTLMVQGTLDSCTAASSRTRTSRATWQHY